MFPDQNYGLAEPLLPAEDDDDDLKMRNINSLNLKKSNRLNLESEIKEQSDSHIWHTERRNRLTASNFGRVCKSRPTTTG